MDVFLENLRMVIVMVGHSQLKRDLSVFDGLIVLDTRNVCGDGENVHKL